MDDWELFEEVEKTLAEYRAATWAPFIRPDGKGVLYYLGDTRPNASPINTALLCRLGDALPSYTEGVSQDERERWKGELVIPALALHVAKITQHLDIPERAEYEAYRVARLLAAVRNTEAENALLSWVESYTRKWLLGAANFEPNLFIIYLALEAVGTNLGFPARNVQRLAHFALAHQVAFGTGDLRTDLDAIDLALAMAMSDVTSVPSRLFATGLEVLDRQASLGRTWRNQQLLLRVGDSVVGCSAFEACLALLKGGSGLRVSLSLRNALVSHCQWLREQRPAHRPWRVSDLSVRSAITEPWFNCLVVEFLVSLQGRLEEATQTALRTKYRARFVRGTLAWPDMVLGRAESEAVRRAFIEPILANSGRRLSQCTAILFGPPGTSKSTIAETLADEAGWPFIELGVADFLVKGLDAVFSVATEIFRDLLRLDRVVVLLDEVEGVFADREDRTRDLRQKFLTSALLPPLRQVKKRGRILLLIATNHIAEFDTAVRRPGRIDLIIPVGPPDQLQRRRLLKGAPVHLAHDIADALEPLLPKCATIEEVLAVERLLGSLTGTPLEAAVALHRAWLERYANGQIDDEAMRKFNDDRQKYARLD